MLNSGLAFEKLGQLTLPEQRYVMALWRAIRFSELQAPTIIINAEQEIIKKHRSRLESSDTSLGMFKELEEIAPFWGSFESNILCEK